MIYKYKEHTADLFANGEVIIIGKAYEYAKRMWIDKDKRDDLNHIIYRIKKEINLLIKKRVSDLIEENQGNIQL